MSRFPALDDDTYQSKLDEQLETIAAKQTNDGSKKDGDVELVDRCELLANMPQSTRAEASAMLEDPNLMSGGLSDPARRYLDTLRQWAERKEFTTTEAFDKVKSQFSRRAVTGWFEERDRSPRGGL